MALFQSTKSILFNGSTQYGTAGNVLNFDRTSTFSISFWIKDITSGTVAVSKMGPAIFQGYAVWAGSGINFQLGDGSGSVQVFTGDIGLVSSGWHHIVVTWDGDVAGGALGALVYVDGVLTAAPPTSDNLTGSMLNTASFRVAGRELGPQYWGGLLDEVAVYSKELTADEVLWIFNAGWGNDLKHASAPSNLVSWWRLGENASLPTIPDAVAPAGYSPLTTSLLLDGVAFGKEQIVYGAVASLKPERTSPFSWNIWWKTTTATNDSAFSQYGFGGWVLQMDGGGVGNARLLGPRSITETIHVESSIAGGAPNVRDGNWHMITAVTDGNDPLTAADLHIFIDGVEMTGSKRTDSGANTITLTTVDAGSQMYVGGQYGQGLEWPGNLCHASAWNVALTAAQVAELYGGGKPQVLIDGVGGTKTISVPNPIFWDTLGDGDALGSGNMLDLSGNGNHGTCDVGVDAGDFVSDAPGTGNDLTLVNTPTVQDEAPAGSGYDVTYVGRGADVVTSYTLEPEVEHSATYYADDSILKGYTFSPQDTYLFPTGPTISYKMRAIDSDPPSPPNPPRYITWVVQNNPDFGGTYYATDGEPTPNGAMVPGSAVVVSRWEE